MIEITDRTPQMADVVSGAVNRPREPRDGENLTEWFAQTPAGKDFENGVEFISQGRIPQRFERLGFAYMFRRGDDLIAVNADGTRYAIERGSAVLAILDLLDDIRTAMTTQGITQQEAARISGITQANISSMLSGRYTPRVDMLERLANAVGLKLKLVKR